MNLSLAWLGLAGGLPLAAGVQSTGWQSVLRREPQGRCWLADMIGSGNAAAPHTRQAAAVHLRLLNRSGQGRSKQVETFKFSGETS